MALVPEVNIPFSWKNELVSVRTAVIRLVCRLSTVLKKVQTLVWTFSAYYCLSYDELHELYVKNVGSAWNR